MLMNTPPRIETYPPVWNSFEIERGIPPEDVLELRRDYVTRVMKWLPPEKHLDDSDRYDGLANTYHFTRRADDGSIIATMRLTEVEAIESSLSYEMLRENEHFQEVVSQKQAVVNDGRLWDLTRLTPAVDGRHDAEVIGSGMVELFGMAEHISTSHAQDSEKVYWIFTTTPWMMRFFAANGIETEEFGRDKLTNADGRLKDTLFCKVDVYAAVAALSASPEHQATYHSLKKGIEGAEVSHVYA